MWLQLILSLTLRVYGPEQRQYTTEASTRRWKKWTIAGKNVLRCQKWTRVLRECRVSLSVLWINFIKVTVLLADKERQTDEQMTSCSIRSHLTDFVRRLCFFHNSLYTDILQPCLQFASSFFYSEVYNSTNNKIYHL